MPHTSTASRGPWLPLAILILVLAPSCADEAAPPQTPAPSAAGGFAAASPTAEGLLAHLRAGDPQLLAAAQAIAAGRDPAALRAASARLGGAVDEILSPAFREAAAVEIQRADASPLAPPARSRSRRVSISAATPRSR